MPSYLYLRAAAQADKVRQTYATVRPTLLAALSNLTQPCCFYRDARSAKRGIAIVSCPSVRPSVCLSVMLIYRRRRIGWTSSKLITRISLGSSLLGATTIYSPRETPQNSGGVDVLNRNYNYNYNYNEGI